MGNRRIVKELKHFVNFETWGVLVDKHGWITELAVCVFLTFIATPSSLDMWNFGALFAKKNKRQHEALDASTKIGNSLSNSSLRKQPTFRDATTGFPAKWRLRNELTNAILMTRHYLDLFGWKFASTSQKHYSHLRSFLRRHFVGKTVVASRNCGCFLRPFKLLTKQRSIMNEQNRQNAKPRKWNVTHRFSFHVTYKVLFSAICVCVLNLILLRGADPGKL